MNSGDPFVASPPPTCKGVDVCNTAFEYESESPTPTSNRVCSALSVCDLRTTFIAANATATSNRGCTNITSCTSTQFTVSAATTYSDTVCSALAVCSNTTTYVSVAESTTSDRECTNLTMCTSDQYESTKPSTFSDRSCSNLTACPSTDFRSGFMANGDANCTALTACGQTQYEFTAPTISSDRSCKDALVCDFPVSQFTVTSATTTSDTVCGSLTDCSTTQYEATPATQSSDRICESAPIPSPSPATSVATFTLGVKGFTKATFTTAVQTAFENAITSQLDCQTCSVAITDVQDRTSSRRLQSGASGIDLTVSITGEGAGATSAAATFEKEIESGGTAFTTAVTLALTESSIAIPPNMAFTTQADPIKPSGSGKFKCGMKCKIGVGVAAPVAFFLVVFVYCIWQPSKPRKEPTTKVHSDEKKVANGYHYDA